MVFNQNGAVGLKPEHIVIVGFFAGMLTHIGSINLFVLKRFKTFFAVLVISHVGNKAGSKSEAGSRNCRIGRVADGTHHLDELIGYFVREAETQFTSSGINLAVDRGVLEPDEGVGCDVTNGQEIQFSFHQIIVTWMFVYRNRILNPKSEIRISPPAPKRLRRAEKFETNFLLILYFCIWICLGFRISYFEFLRPLC